MQELILNAIIWTLALYGLFEIIKTIVYIYSFTNLKSDGIYLIIAAKNQENKIEGFLRSLLFRFLYGKDDYIKDIIVTDLDSSDSTTDILYRLQDDYECIKVVNWRECKDIIDSIDHN